MTIREQLRPPVAAVLWGWCVLATSAYAQEDAGVLRLSLSEEDGAAPTLSLSPGRVTTLAFVDERGQPVSIAELVGPEDGWLRYEEVPSHRHVVALRALRSGTGNIVAFLAGVDRPAHFELTVGDGPGPTQVEVQAALSVTAPASAAAPRGDGAAALRGAELNAAIRDYLLSNPDVLREALDPTRQLAATAQRLRGDILGAAGVPAAGDESAPVTVVEFFDYRCGYCKRSLDAVRMALERTDVRVELREYPILGDDSARAARAALAAARQGRYVDVHLALMAHEGEYDEESIRGIAIEAGLDAERLFEDMQSAEVAALIDTNRALARRLGVSGTPAFLVAGPDAFQASPGALDVARLTNLIEEAASQ